VAIKNFATLRLCAIKILIPIFYSNFPYRRTALHLLANDDFSRRR